MPRKYLPLSIVVLLGCGSGDPVAAAKARDLQTALNPTTPVLDATQQRADSQFDVCLFIYTSAEKLRECLVLKFEWTPDNAARRIAIYTAEVRKIADSILAIEERKDSIRYAELGRQQVKRQAERDAADRRAAARQQRDEATAKAAPFWGDPYLKLYYANSTDCATIGRMDAEDRVIFRSAEEAEKAGYRRTLESYC